MSQPSLNPFHPAEAVIPKIKALVFGAAGVGKTYLSLTSPGRIAIIDTEGGTAFYARRAGTHGLSQFDVLPTKTYRDVQAAVQYIAANPNTYATLVIDPVTVIYEVLQDAALIKRAEVNRRKGRGGDSDDTDLEMLDWGRIKRAYKALMTELGNLPVHVIVTAREKAEQERKGNEVVTIGQKADAEKSTGYYFDTILRMVPTATGREAIILKDRTGIHALNARVQEPTFDSLFGAVITSGKGATAARAIPSDEKAAETDAATTLSAPWTGARVRTEASHAGIVKAKVEAAYGAVAAGRTPDLLSPEEWRRMAVDLGLAEPGPADEFTAEDIAEVLAEEPAAAESPAPTPDEIIGEPVVIDSATPAEALAKTPQEAAADVAVRRAARLAEPSDSGLGQGILDGLAATVPAEPEGLFPAPADDGLVAAAMAFAAEQRVWKEGEVHTPGHKGLIRNARGLFCATRLPDGKWCQWTERSA